MGLNPAQKKAVRHRQGPCLVLAGPGSGKTLTIARRIEYLVTKYQVRPEEILVITFTRDASYEMKCRFQHVTGGKNLPVTFGTFHGIYFGILKWAYGYQSSNIMTEEEKYKLLSQILNSPELDTDMEIADEREYIRELISEIGKVKNSRIHVEEYESAQHGAVFQDIYQMYEKERRRLRKIDFDDMLILCYDLFLKRPDILKRWQEKFRYILVDEFQDINRVQYDIIRLLALPENNLFVVGDDDQAIYRFRGADPAIMLGFCTDYPDAEKIHLDINYRSDAFIVNGALRVICHNEKRYGKKIQAEQAKGECVHVQEVRDPAEESKYVTEEIRRLIAGGMKPEQIAVLFRTSLDVRVLAETLLEYQVPFRMKEHLNNLYEHFIARNLKSYFKLAMGNRERQYFLNVMNCPKRYLGRECLENPKVAFEELRNFYCDKEWMQDRIDQFEWDLKMLENKPPFAAIQYIRKKIGYDEYLKEYASFRHLREEELFDVLNQIEERAAQFKTMEEWIQYTEDYGEALKQQNVRGKQLGGVGLLTMHGAKGLEYDTVFIIGGNEGTVPYKKAQLPEEIEEERRMFYVAMTRAKRKLIISYVKTKNGKELSPSRFIQELLVRA